MRKTEIALAAVLTVLAAPGPALAQETNTYSYDALGRLTDATVSGGPRTGAGSHYTLDAAGNRTAVVSSAVPPGVVVNASFEQPNVGADYLYRPSVPDNYYGVHSGVAGNGSAWAFQPAPDGTQVAFIQGYASDNGYIIMNFSGLNTGAAYVVKFMAARRLTYTPNALWVSAQGNGLGLYSPASTTFGEIVTSSFVASGPVGTVAFAGTTGGDSATGVDAVAIVPVP